MSHPHRVSSCPDSKHRAGGRPRRDQEDAERRAARREHEAGPRQVQNAAANPAGQHEAAHRRVRVHVKTEPSSFPSSYPGNQTMPKLLHIEPLRTSNLSEGEE